MKKLIYFFVTIACVAFALSATSCKDKEKDDEVYENYYTFNGTTYPILSAGIVDFTELELYGFNFSRYAANEVTEETPSSFITFMISEEEFGELIPNFEGVGFIDTTLGITDPVLSSGSLKVVKNGDNFTVDFDVTFEDQLHAKHRLTGHYSGAMEIVPDGGIGPIGPTGPTG